MPNIQAKKSLKREDLVHLVTAPVLSQVNQNSAQILKRIGELQEVVETIARQIARQIPKADGEVRVDDANAGAVRNA